jgi:hypothetical protein
MCFWSEAELAAALRAIDLKAAADPKFEQLALLRPREALEQVSRLPVCRGPGLTIFDHDPAWVAAPVVPAMGPVPRRQANLREIAALFLT